MSVELFQFFKFDHLKPELQAISKPFCMLAHELHATLPDNLERDEAFRKLLEAKDCAVRAYLYKKQVL